MSHLIDSLNQQAEKVEAMLNEQVAANAPCVVCPDSGCIVLDFSDCSNFEVLVTEDITCMRIFGEGAPGNIDFVIPPNTTRFITGFPAEWFSEGNEGSIALLGGADGRTYGFRHSGNVGGGVSGGGGRPGIPRKKTASDGASGSGGGAGGACPCIPDKGKLTLVVCGKFNCGDASPKFEVKACGGMPGAGYSWSFTGKGIGTISGIDSSKFSLAPPVNAGGFPGVTAYTAYWLGLNPAFNCGALDIKFQNRGCDGLSNGACTGCGGSPCTACQGSDFKCCANPITDTCGVDSIVFAQCAAHGDHDCNIQVDKVKDKRTQAMIDAGCEPCEVMNLVVVTVTDALGTSVSKTVGA